MKTSNLQTYAIAYILGVSYKDISNTSVDEDNDIIVVYYTARYYNSPLKLRKVLSYLDVHETAKIHGRALINI